MVEAMNLNFNMKYNGSNFRTYRVRARTRARARKQNYHLSQYKNKKTLIMITIIKHLFNAVRYSLQGLRDALEKQFAFRLEIFLSAIIIPCAFYFGATMTDKILLFSSWMLVIIVELINSAIEIAIDRISLERHELSRMAKDLGSAAVLLACVNVAVVWFFLIFGK